MKQALWLSLALLLPSCSLFKGTPSDEEKTGEGPSIPPPKVETPPATSPTETKVIATQTVESTDLSETEAAATITDVGGWDVQDPTENLPSKRDLTAPIIPLSSFDEEANENAKEKPIIIQPQ
ncbi:MAG: hypothetical protein AAGC74_09225 [Verrucomicrobiota bacterium]